MMKFLIIVLLACSALSLKPERNYRTMIESDVPVVVELFTSQGCSSCPAADQLLNDMIQSSRENRQPVIGLSFHVTYWNYLGWKDPYSNEAFTERQKKYAAVLHLPSIYTPQMIVNGTREFVGSDEHTLSASLAGAHREKPVYRITATVSRLEEAVTIQYSLDKEPAGEWLNIAVVENSVENYIPRGENQGLTLRHYNVVRYFETRKITVHDEVKLKLPALLDVTKGASVVLYVQDPVTAKVVSVLRIGLM